MYSVSEAPVCSVAEPVKTDCARYKYVYIIGEERNVVLTDRYDV